MSNITIFQQTGLVSFVDKKGAAHELTGEAAIFKRGEALAAMTDIGFDLALSKAHNGKYRAAAEILAVAFPSTAKAFEKLHGVIPWSNKASMLSFIGALENVKPGKSGDYTKKQQAARGLLSALRGIPAFARAADEAVTVDA